MAPDKSGEVGEIGEPEHLSVLAKEAVELLSISAGDTVVDGTVGGGGHAEQILRLIGPTGKLIAMDCDQYAIERATRRLGPRPGLTLIRENFRNLKETLERLGSEKIDALLLDLGLSSFHLGLAERGFSFSVEAQLDMRMDQRLELTAADIVNDYSESELTNILWRFGEEPNARRIARAMVRERSKKEIRTTTELADLIRRVTPRRPSRRARIDPSTRTFQALRIEVNSELDSLSKALDDGISALRPGGRLSIISFHSLEDRIVKKTFVREARACVCPPDFPVCVCDKKPTLKILTPRPITPSADEIAVNPRSRSAKLRAAEKIAVEEAS